jgi:glycosyltransferase involved in cell wall biosynthesis
MTEAAAGVSCIATAQAQEYEPLFSIVIPTFNRMDLLKQTLNSVFAQRFTSCELIVVDDGSTDPTVHLLRFLEPRLTFFTQPNRGPSSARNLGASPARGVYLAFRITDYLASGDRWRWWGASSFIIRRDAFLAVGGFTDKCLNGEDADLALRLRVAGKFVQIATPVTFAYREHAASAVHAG